MAMKFKSFKLSDGEVINEFMKDKILASGANVFVSNGDILIPFEDGEDMNLHQLILWHKELRNKKSQELMLLTQSQMVNVRDADFILSEINKLKEEEDNAVALKGKEEYNRNKQIKDLLKELQNKLDQKQNIIMMNNVEAQNINVNIETFNTLIGQFEEQLKN